MWPTTHLRSHCGKNVATCVRDHLQMWSERSYHKCIHTCTCELSTCDWITNDGWYYQVWTGLLSPFITGIKFKGQTHPSSPMIKHSSPSGPQMTLKSTVTLRGSMEIVKIPQIERHKHTFSPFFIHSNLWGNLLVTYCHIKYKGPLWCGILKNLKAELGPI